MRLNTIAFAAVALAAATPAMAQDFVVPYHDLDLSDAQDQAKLERRIDQRARDYCLVDAKRTGSRVRHASVTACYANLRLAARQQMASIVSEVQKGG
ncbi:hypothetical protein GCM10011515_24720 [Tsuneonella deserti]|uniref:UrcA family protein n=1 Tax=Tsuneonella deserti TaxID=2035528 RepID=A0ABQ1SAJ4_9SPHN|nr:UrcA family protein [Tsuneonella deserti]GGE04164.1 hypothetical protein GCM10011515_24720 [Tsuneonella deserti]